MLARVQIQHELNEGPLQSCSRPGKTDEAAPAQFRGALRIEKLQLRSKRNMIESVGQRRLFSPAPNDRIVLRIFSHRRIGMRQIGNSEHQLLLLLIQLRCLLVEPGNLVPDFAHPRLDFFRRLAFRALAANLLAQPFAVRVVLLECRLPLAPFRIHPQDLVDLRCVIAAARGQPAFHKVSLFTNEPDIEHGLEYQRDPASANTPS